MAIDRTGISSLDAGAGDITYSGNEGPKSPDQQLMAQADPMVVEMYQQYVFEMEEQGLQPMSFREFLQQAMSGMAEGGIARLGLKKGGRPHEQWEATRKSYERATSPGGEGADRWVDRNVKKFEAIRAADEFEKIKEKPRLPLSNITRGIGSSLYTKKGKTRALKHMSDYISSLNNPYLEDWYDDLEEKDKLSADMRDLLAYSNIKGVSGEDYNYGTFLKDIGKPGILHKGDVGRLGDRYVKYTGEVDDYGNKIKATDDYGNVLYGYNESTGGGDGQAGDLIPYSLQASAPVDEEDETAQWQAPEIPVDPIRFAADGGRMGYAGGGIADLRQGYFLGKLVKKAGRALKKVAKSPIGRIGLMALGGWGLNKFGPTAGWVGGLKDLAGEKKWLGNLLLNQERTDWSPWKLGIGAASLYPLIKGMGDDEEDDFTQTDLYKRWLAQKQGWDQTFAPVGDPANFQPIRYADGGRTGYADGYMVDDEEEENHRAAALAAMYKNRIMAQEGGRIGYQNGKLALGEGFKSEELNRMAIDMFGKELRLLNRDELEQLRDEYNIKKGVIEMASAPDPMDERNQVMEMIARDTFGKPLKDLTEDEIIEIEIMLEEMSKKQMPQPDRVMAQEGGLMDLGGMEKDYRNEGGFVPIGGQERADDVPARLSKNEFVFTADAVRNAGGGDIDKGAEIMENLMENLENGGKVSEDSQGLEGARNMFATSQRLEGVL